jgi:hypothetical protein
MRFMTGVVALALAATACSGNPQPGQSGYPYNIQGEYELTIEIDADTFAGIAVMQTQLGGDVTGTAEIESPERITGEFVGNVTSKLYVFTLTYQRGDCKGVGRGSAEVAAGGEMVVGTMEIGDECAEAVMYANVTLRR